MTHRYVHPLEGGGAAITEVGGKAAGIDRLVGHGFPVPRAVALTADSYRRVVTDAGLASHLRRLATEEIPPPDRIDAEKARAEEMFLEAAIPAAVAEEIAEAAGSLLEAGPISVRSSSPAGGPGAGAFAGQHLTVLDVTSTEEALRAVRRCWASLWWPSVRAYRRREGLEEADPAMAVVLQEMVAAEYAGVMFTRDPIGDSSLIRIELTHGPVNSPQPVEAAPDVLWIERAGLTVAGHRGEVPAFVEDLARLGMLVEHRLADPQAVEWVFGRGRLLLLQCRPAATGTARRIDDDGFDTVPAEEDVYTSAGIQEMLPGVVPPLLWSINAPMLDDAFRRLFAYLGLPIPSRDGLLALGRFRGRAALNLSVLRRAAAAIPGGSADDVDLQYLGRVLTEAPEPEEPRPGRRLGRLQTGLRAAKLRRHLDIETRLVTDATHLILALGVEVARLPVDRLLAYWEHIRGLAWRAYAAEIAASAGAAAAYRALESALHRWLEPSDAASWVQRVTAGPVVARQPGCACVAEFWQVYGGGTVPGTYLDSVLDHEEAADEREQAVMAMMNSAARHFGSKAIYGGPNWDEEQIVVRQSFRALAAGLAPDPATRMETARRERAEALEGLARSLGRSWRWRMTRLLTGQIVDLRRRMLRRLAADAARLLAFRETAKAAVLTIGGEERRLICEAAARLQASGVLRSAADVHLLTASEIELGLLGGEPVAGGELERRRVAYREALAGDPLPEHFRGVPGSVGAPPAADAEVLEGWAAGPGLTDGPARVITDVAEGGRLQSGDILVARSTDPSWTPLFMLAGGIVLEEGGPLSHAAIVAREFGLPAVLNVRGATRAIRDGEWLTVDGTAGVVSRSTGEADS